ncbi:myb-related transcription factor, partner of profilin-like [Ambystoma mexicanum]|uniref:myb-related transcription factor, partner of profilin-like n=1 Tax=Ambystoma mexicanum TaxID=8296 RepID=UPI0037E99F5B
MARRPSLKTQSIAILPNHLLIPVEHCGNTLRMSKATRKTTPRLQKQRFSDAELNMLVDTIAAHADLMKSHDMKREVQQKKKDIWQEVARKVSAVETTSRTVRDCCKRWDDLRLWVRNIMSSNRRAVMAKGGGPHSPAKMMPWEETARSFIDPELIEGFREIEMGVTSSPEGGTDEEDARQENTARASTSHQKKRTTTTTTSMADKQATPTGSVPDRVETQPTTPAASVPDIHQTQQPTPTPVGGESLHAPASTEDDLDGNVDLEGVTEVTCPPSPSPRSTTQPHIEPSPTYSSGDPCLHDSDLSTIEEDSTQNAGPVSAPPTTPAPTNTLESCLSRVEAQQEAMLDLLRQYIADGEESRRGIATAIEGTTAAIA